MQSKRTANLTTSPAIGQLPFWVIGALLLLAMAKLSLQLWGANKGFDIWDEGLYLLMLNFYDQYPNEPHNYYSYVMAALVPLEEYGLLPLRFLAIATETAGIAFFAYCVHRFWQARVDAPLRFPLPVLPLMLFVFITAAFLSVYPRAFSYNDFSYLSTLVVGGALLLVFKKGFPSTRMAKTCGLLLLFFIGLLLGAQLIVKFSTALLLLGWAVLFVLLFIRGRWWYQTFLVGALLAGFLASLLTILQGYTGVVTWLGHLQKGIELLKLISYDPYFVLVKGYLWVDLVENGAFFMVPLLVAFIANRIAKNRLYAYGVGLVAWLAVSLVIKNGFLGEFHYRFIALHIYSLLFWGWPVVRQLAKSKQWLWLTLVGMLVALPFVALLGSSNTATQTITRYLASWLVLTALFVSHCYPADSKKRMAVLAIIVAYSLINYVVVQVYHPYGLNAPLMAQTNAVTGLRYLDHIRFDTRTAAFFEGLKEATTRSGYPAGGPILALGDLCGAATAMGGYIPETFWYFSDANAISSQHSRSFSCMHLGNLRIAEHPRLPLVMINSGIHHSVIDCLKASEVPFATDYYLVNTLYNPYAQESLAVWAPFNWELPK